MFNKNLSNHESLELVLSKLSKKGKKIYFAISGTLQGLFVAFVLMVSILSN